MNYLDKLIGYIEVHSAEGIRECFANGVNVNDLFRNEPLIYELTSEYIRSSSFKDCVKAFVDYGLEMETKYCYQFYRMMPGHSMFSYQKTRLRLKENII
jgi:hypothetical protein